MFLLNLVILGPLLLMMVLLVAKLLGHGYDIKWWQIIFVPPLLIVLGIILLAIATAIPFFFMGLCLVLAAP